jgi:hypothetical protein
MARRSITIERPVETIVEKQTCQHHWLIEPALGPTSNGVCKRCGAVKIFLNIVEDSQPKEITPKIAVGILEEEAEDEAVEEADEDTD